MLGVVPVAAAVRRDGRLRASASCGFPGGTPFFLLLLLGLTLPFEAVIVPLYYQMQRMGLLNTRLGLILPLIGLNMPFAVFWMRTHFQSIPKEIYESAALDGAGAWQASGTSRSRWRSPRSPRCAVLLFLGTWNSSCSPSC